MICLHQTDSLSSHKSLAQDAETVTNIAKLSTMGQPVMGVITRDQPVMSGQVISAEIQQEAMNATCARCSTN